MRAGGGGRLQRPEDIKEIQEMAANVAGTSCRWEEWATYCVHLVHSVLPAERR